MNFWSKLLDNKPIIGLSPMDGVTDVAMRYMSAKYGRPDVMFSEFVSVDALAHAKEEKSVDRVMRAFIKARDVDKYSSNPVTQYSSELQEIRKTGKPENQIWPYEVAQVFGHTPELFYQAAVIIATLGFDGMDINMGCPAHKVEEQGSGAGLIRTPEVAQEIVRAAKRGMKDFVDGKVEVRDLGVSDMVKEWVLNHAKGDRGSELLPVSVKTRIGVSEVVVEQWMETLMEVEPAMISLHGRTLKQLYMGQADWEAIGRAAEVVHALGGHILGNGDVLSITDGKTKVDQYGVDGFLIGRNAEGNPGIFLDSSIPVTQFSSELPVNGDTAKLENSLRKQRLDWMLEHAKVYEQVFGSDNFMPMRKHLAWYCKGFPGAGELRSKLVQANSLSDVKTIIGFSRF